MYAVLTCCCADLLSPRRRAVCSWRLARTCSDETARTASQAASSRCEAGSKCDACQGVAAAANQAGCKARADGERAHAGQGVVGSELWQRVSCGWQTGREKRQHACVALKTQASSGGPACTCAQRKSAWTCPPPHPGLVPCCCVYVCLSQLSEAVRSYLQQAEEEFRAAKEEQRHALWDDKMRATQTQSAFGVSVT